MWPVNQNMNRPPTSAWCLCWQWRNKNWCEHTFVCNTRRIWCGMGTTSVRYPYSTLEWAPNHKRCVFHRADSHAMCTLVCAYVCVCLTKRTRVRLNWNANERAYTHICMFYMWWCLAGEIATAWSLDSSSGAVYSNLLLQENTSTATGCGRRGRQATSTCLVRVLDLRAVHVFGVVGVYHLHAWSSQISGRDCHKLCGCVRMK